MIGEDIAVLDSRYRRAPWEKDGVRNRWEDGYKDGVYFRYHGSEYCGQIEYRVTNHYHHSSAEWYAWLMRPPGYVRSQYLGTARTKEAACALVEDALVREFRVACSAERLEDTAQPVITCGNCGMQVFGMVGEPAADLLARIPWQKRHMPPDHRNVPFCPTCLPIARRKQRHTA